MKSISKIINLLTWKRALFVIILFVLVLAPLVAGRYSLRFLTNLCMWVGMAAGWNMFNGFTGHIDFGYVVYFGVGAYVTTLFILELSFPFLLAVPIGACFSALLALLISLPTLKLTGAYFAIATWSLAEAIKQLTLNLPGLTGGSSGLSLPPLLNTSFFYYLMFGTAVIIFMISYAVKRSQLGYHLEAIRGSEVAAECLGINVFRNKLAAFLLSAFSAGLIGGIYAYWITYVHPFNVFDMLITDKTIVMVLLGGSGTLLGPVVGAVLMFLAMELLWAEIPGTLYLVVLGIMLVGIIIFVPDGVVGTWQKERWRVKEKLEGVGLWKRPS